MYGGNFQSLDSEPQGLLDWLGAQPNVLSQFPRFKECSWGGGVGAPTVHIPVAELTEYSSSYIPVGGSYAGGASDPAHASSRTTTTASKGSSGGGFTAIVPMPQPSPVTALSQETNPSVHFVTPFITPFEQSTVEVSPSHLASPAVLAPASDETQRPAQQAKVHISISLVLVPIISAAESPPIKETDPAAAEVPPVTDLAATVASGILGALHRDAPALTLGNGDKGPGPIVVGGITATPVGSSSYVLPGSQMVKAGGPAVIYSGTTYPIDDDDGGVIVNGKPIFDLGPDSTGNGAVQIGALTAIVVASGAYILPGGRTLQVSGAPVTVSGTTYSVDSSSAVVINGQTISRLPKDATALAPVTIGNAVADRIASDAFVISRQTLRAGGPPITISGTTYSLSPSEAIVVDGQTVSSLAGTPNSEDRSVITIGTMVLNAIQTPEAALVVSGHTLYLGGPPVTISADGHLKTLSLSADALLPNGDEIVVIDGQTQTLHPDQNIVTEPDGAVLVFTPTTATEMIVAGKTLIPGGTVIITDGVTLGEEPEGATIQKSGGMKSTSGIEGGVGSYIVSGLDGQASSTKSPASFSGEGAVVRFKGSLGITLASMGVFGLLLFL